VIQAQQGDFLFSRYLFILILSNFENTAYNSRS
jgi:hypothetical protein